MFISPVYCLLSVNVFFEDVKGSVLTDGHLHNFWCEVVNVKALWCLCCSFFYQTQNYMMPLYVLSLTLFKQTKVELQNPTLCRCRGPHMVSHNMFWVMSSFRNFVIGYHWVLFLFPSLVRFISCCILSGGGAGLFFCTPLCDYQFVYSFPGRFTKVFPQYGGASCSARNKIPQLLRSALESYGLVYTEHYNVSRIHSTCWALGLNYRGLEFWCSGV